MSDIMLHAILNLPSELWIDSPLDMLQRSSRYKQASTLIDRQKHLLIEAYVSQLKSANPRISSYDAFLSALAIYERNVHELLPTECLNTTKSQITTLTEYIDTLLDNSSDERSYIETTKLILFIRDVLEASAKTLIINGINDSECDQLLSNRKLKPDHGFVIKDNNL